MLRATLDRLRKVLRRNFTEREINSREMLSIQRVELRIVCSAVLGTKPPSPVAALSGQERFVGLL